MRAPYTQILTPDERAQCLAFGATLKLAQHRVPVNKTAEVFNSGNVGKAIIATTLLTGIPIGIVAHLMGRSITSRKMKEREMDQKIKYYRAATQGIETGLAEGVQ
jgi:hypothetical protein